MIGDLNIYMPPNTNISVPRKKGFFSSGFIVAFVIINIVFLYVRGETAAYHLRYEIQWTSAQQEMIDHDLRAIAELKKALGECRNDK